MKKLIAMAVAALGVLASSAAYTGCILAFLDEPEMAKKMIER